jgi:chorismate dehydratase
VALVSSIELFRRPRYRYLSGLGVIGEGPVDSVKLFLRKPIEDVRRVAFDPASRAAAALVRVVLRALPSRAGAGMLDAVDVEPDADPAGPEADAWLRIGDAALATALGPDAPPSFDPAAAWLEVTGLPFVFATWTARPEVDLEPWLGAFQRARARGAERTPAIARETAERLELPVEACEHYFLRQCRYELDPLRQSAALLAFRDKAAALDLCSPDLRPAAIPLPGGRSRS